MDEDIEVWNVICQGLYVTTIEVKDEYFTRVVPKIQYKYNDSK